MNAKKVFKPKGFVHDYRLRLDFILFNNAINVYQRKNEMVDVKTKKESRKKNEL